MRQLLTLAGILILLNLLLLIPNPTQATDGPKKQSNCRVGIVFDVGGRGDKSFNDSAYIGLQRALKELPVEGRYLEPGEGADREAALRLLAAQGYDLVIGVGFIFSDDLRGVAADYPNLNFAGIDYALAVDKDGNPIPPPANLSALKFREDQGSFLAGALSALQSESGKIGFVGGMNIPLIKRFESGFEQGAKAINPNIKVTSNYAGVNSAAFKDPGKGKELATGQYASGVDMIYHASGATGLGVFEAARQFGKYAIGVDSDQAFEAPDQVMASMVKRVDNAVYKIIDECAQKKIVKGVRHFGVKEGGVDLIFNPKLKPKVSPEKLAKLDALRQEIIDGKRVLEDAHGN